jgi:hypothetical protein
VRILIGFPQEYFVNHRAPVHSSVYSILLLALFAGLVTGCIAESVDDEPLVAAEDWFESDAKLPGGVAQNIYYECTTATNVGSDKWSYKTRMFNNTSSKISLEIYKNSSLIAGIYPTKATTNTFVESTYDFRLELVNKRSGPKSIRVVHRDRRASEENGFCRSYDLNAAPPRTSAHPQCAQSTFGVLKDCLPLIVLTVGVKACELCAAGAIPALSTGVGALPWAGTCLTCIGTVGVCGFRAKDAIDQCF